MFFVQGQENTDRLREQSAMFLYKVRRMQTKGNLLCFLYKVRRTQID